MQIIYTLFIKNNINVVKKLIYNIKDIIEKKISDKDILLDKI
jgi:hypothetical protein